MTTKLVIIVLPGSVKTTVFDTADGVRSSSTPVGLNPPVASLADGRLWFVTPNGIGVVDPRHLPFNALPPPVQIEQIVADRKTYDTATSGPVRLPPRIHDLQIDYTALSLVAPEKVAFRYKLEGFDRDWHDAGSRRQAFYTDLPPRQYRFRVAAANNRGSASQCRGRDTGDSSTSIGVGCFTVARG